MTKTLPRDSGGSAPIWSGKSSTWHAAATESIGSRRGPGSARRHEDRVGEVDGGVGGGDAAADDVGVVDLEGVTGSGDVDHALLDGGLLADDLVGGELAGHDVVGEDLGEQGAVGLEGVDGGRRDLGERGVDGGEDGELAAVEGVDQVDLG